MKRYLSHIAVNVAMVAVAATDYLIADGNVVGLVVNNPKAAALTVAGINLANIAFKTWLAARKTAKP